MKLLITTGATVTFTRLLRFVLSDPMLSTYITTGFRHVTVQYGNEIKNGVHVSRCAVNEILRSTAAFKHFQVTDDTCSFEYHDKGGSRIVLEFLSFSPDLNSLIRSSDLIISHGGTGTLIDILKLHKKLIVVYNESLMDNHQKQIAEEFARSQFCVSVGSSQLEQDEFTGYLQALRDGKIVLTSYHSPVEHIVQSIVYRELAHARLHHSRAKS
ncbi:N-acetylglucosaminyldiphosphodolichol N-acetylglucosaminyltransferase catalytic subunit alg13 [Yamadazyma tenuis]|uniref:UDP-N-acetylglucosamine transferase subunit ALG13 n=1 Tax=Candida tenuis (strain ATCC 10573 / BCRC 21748 / CBS 615 / JCM 9827 / NBRC 10315 / NRRL Y-1498 / VKM Y-70) TaxID=590646 RepID=G3B9M3_CANTC|nr:uncharacterized protein CANTEDRAFT_125274 [Yamadazyma tenuis ATCC 10573]EGV61926.1 hypothetical protein CANTEDRAFT_125274 [Yamadazyma tenuis ATCC 10573]WEJ93160.1 N-acetylglucosaminyldiphosphodolichol N-acetylglucosaminyltransferase catalytic subunit alg13 [Yamadazyma tenuis]